MPPTSTEAMSPLDNISPLLFFPSGMIWTVFFFFLSLLAPSERFSFTFHPHDETTLPEPSPPPQLSCIVLFFDLISA